MKLTLGRSGLLYVAVFVFLFVIFTQVLAAPVTPAQARIAVSGWLRGRNQPLSARLGERVLNISQRRDSSATTLYYVVRLHTSGVVVVASDDLIEPIVAFSGECRSFENSPLALWLDTDMSARLRLVRGRSLFKTNRALRTEQTLAQAKWKALCGQYRTLAATVSDPRVSPFVMSKWGQGSIAGVGYCYDYYTPNHYPAGCVATALAQVMRYHRVPTIAVGTPSFNIKIDSVTAARSLMGGDGSGGSYDWDQMPLNPAAGANDTQRRMIGRLCSDAGVASNMEYSTSASSAGFRAPRKALVDTFGYSNAVVGTNGVSDITSSTKNIVNPNLDAKMPVMLAINGSDGAHAVVCDGYGYDSSTLYHHLNFGWSGLEDAWYNLPNATSSYTSVITTIYNIMTTGTGEVVSGRILDSTGDPISASDVTATASGAPSIVYTGVSDENGIYALAGVPSSVTLSISAKKAGRSFEPITVPVGVSRTDTLTCGNVWGADIIAGVAIDVIPPTCVVTSAVVATNTSSIRFTLTFSEPVVGLTRDKAMVTNGVVWTLSGSGSVYQVNVTPAGQGAVTCLIPAGACVDAFSNPNLVSNIASTIFDSVRPVVTLSKAEGQADPARDCPVQFTATFNDPVTDLRSADVKVNGTASGTVSVKLTGGPSIYTIAVSGLVSDGTVSVSIPADSAIDAAGNGNAASTGEPSVVYVSVVVGIAITSPTRDAVFGRNVGYTNLSGTMSGFVGETIVSWLTDKGAAGTCTVGTGWSSGEIPLASGDNIISVTASDKFGHDAAASATIGLIECSPGAAWQGLTMASMPIIPDMIDPKPETGFSLLWAAYRPDLVAYSVYDSADRYAWFNVPSATPGRGFWAYFPSDNVLVPPGTLCSQKSEKKVHLLAGWNLIGMPFASPIVWDTALVRVQATGGDAVPLNKGSDIACSWLWGWKQNASDASSGAYELVVDMKGIPGVSNILEPWRGYWIRAAKECDLIIPPPVP